MSIHAPGTVQASCAYPRIRSICELTKTTEPLRTTPPDGSSWYTIAGVRSTIVRKRSSAWRSCSSASLRSVMSTITPCQ